MRVSESLFKERLSQPPMRVDKLYLDTKLHQKMLEVLNTRDPNFWTRLKACSACSIAQDRPFPPVLPKGDVMSPFVFIGNVPGKLEGEFGHPFHKTSTAGMFMDKYLDALGLTRDQVYLTNALMCPTKEDRDPTGREVMVCSFHKAAEFKLLIKAKFVFVMGNTAARSILGLTQCVSIVPNYGIAYYTKTTSIAGGTVYIFPVFHMGSVVRDRKLYDMVILHLRSIRERYIDPYLEGQGKGLDWEFVW